VGHSVLDYRAGRRFLDFLDRQAYQVVHPDREILVVRSCRTTQDCRAGHSCLVVPSFLVDSSCADHPDQAVLVDHYLPADLAVLPVRVVQVDLEGRDQLASCFDPDFLADLVVQPVRRVLIVQVHRSGSVDMIGLHKDMGRPTVPVAPNHPGYPIVRVDRRFQEVQVDQECLEDMMASGANRRSGRVVGNHFHTTTDASDGRWS